MNNLSREEEVEQQFHHLFQAGYWYSNLLEDEDFVLLRGDSEFERLAAICAELIIQASGLCFTKDRKNVFVTADGKTWQLVGGYPETGETIEDTFIREAANEFKSSSYCILTFMDIPVL